jgi:hypothetical protein
VIRRGAFDGPNAQASAVVQGVDGADLRKNMVRKLSLKGDYRVLQLAMPDVPAAWIGEYAVAIEYRLDGGRALHRIALAEDFVKVANEQSLDVARHALFSHHPRSDLCLAAIGEQLSASDETGIIGRKE